MPDPATIPLLEVHDLVHRYEDGIPVVRDVSFEVLPGEIFSLLGPSGCGKTTTLRLIAGLETPQSGRVWLGGKLLTEGPRHSVAPERRGVGLVFQDYALFPHLTVRQNVGFGLRGMDRRRRTERIEEMLQLVGLTDLGGRLPGNLSGGQQQRVAIARTLAPAPAVVLMDEPFSNLDARMRQDTRREIRSLLRAAGQTVILVTHDQEEALSVADRVAVMHDGRIEQIGDPETVYSSPRTLFVAQFLGRTNLLLAEAQGLAADTPIGTLKLDRPSTGHVLLSLRPEDVDLLVPSADPERPMGLVTAREYKGHDITYRVSLGTAEYQVHTPAHILFSPGDRVCLRARERAVVLERGD